MQKILVTGAGGYIGSVLVPLLLKNNHHVIALDRFYFGEHTLTPHPNLTIVKEDSRCYDPTLLNDNFAVIDLVAISNDPSGDAFNQATWEINHQSRVRTVKLARQAGVKRYILPSSCSVYGFTSTLCYEDSSVNPLTTYARANLAAESDALSYNNDDFCVTVLRQATIFGASPRMRLDLAINNMVYEAWHNGKISLMRDGSQFRPMLHVLDTSRVMLALLRKPFSDIGGQIFNVGLANFQLSQLADTIREMFKERFSKIISLEWYGDPDHRSYQVDFSKLKKQGIYCEMSLEKGVEEILTFIQYKNLQKNSFTITLKRYQELEYWAKEINSLLMYEGILNIKT